MSLRSWLTLSLHWHRETQIKNQFCFKQWGSLNMHSITKYFEDLGRFCPERPWTNVKAMKVSLCLERLQLFLASNHPFFLVPYRHTDFELKASKVFREKTLKRCGANICGISIYIVAIQWGYSAPLWTNQPVRKGHIMYLGISQVAQNFMVHFTAKWPLHLQLQMGLEI